VSGLELTTPADAFNNVVTEHRSALASVALIAGMKGAQSMLGRARHTDRDWESAQRSRKTVRIMTCTGSTMRQTSALHRTARASAVRQMTAFATAHAVCPVI
jgi:hypothetical protein